MLQLLGLLASLYRPRVIHGPEVGKLTEELSTVSLNSLNLTLEVRELGPSAVIGVSLLYGLFAEAARLEVLLVEETLGASQFVTQV